MRMNYSSHKIWLMLSKHSTILFLFLVPLALCAQSKHNFSVSGTVKDKTTGETLTGATIGFLEHPGLGVVTNSYGFYSITIPEGKYSMVISYSGYAVDTIVLDLKENTYGAPEAVVIGRMIEGLRAVHADDATLLEHGMGMFEALARSFEEK